MAPGQARPHITNFSLPTKTPLHPPAAAMVENTDSVPGATDRRFLVLFQVTPWPPRNRLTRTPVTMPVWFGRVTVFSTSVRALIVPAPCARRSARVGVVSSLTQRD